MGDEPNHTFHPRTLGCRGRGKQISSGQGQSGLKSEFQDSQEYYTKKSYLEKKERRNQHEIHSGEGGQNRQGGWKDEAGKEGRGAVKEREDREVGGKRREEEAVSHGHQRNIVALKLRDSKFFCCVLIPESGTDET